MAGSKAAVTKPGGTVTVTLDQSVAKALLVALTQAVGGGTGTGKTTTGKTGLKK